MKIRRALLAICVLTTSVHAQDVTGAITIKKRLTKRDVTAPVSIYQRGTVVSLGKDTGQDPLAYEMSHVVVYLEGPNDTAQAKPEKTSAFTMEQLDRRFSPDMLVVPAGATISFPNMDPIFHNVFSLSKPKSFDLGSYDKGQSRTISFPKPGLVYIFCRLHPNMEATILVTPNRWYARPDAQGQYRIAGVPPGKYTLVAWHKPPGYFRKQIMVETGHGASADFFIPIDVDADKAMTEAGSMDMPEGRWPLRFRTRAFLICFIPFALLLTGGFWMIQRFVQQTVRDGLRTSLRGDQRAIAGINSRSELQDSRFLRVAGENPALKDGLQLLVGNPGNENARRTVEDQLRELGQQMGFDFLLESGPSGAPLAAVVRTAKDGEAGELIPVPVLQLQGSGKGLVSINGRMLQVASVPIDQNEESIGSLSVGAWFDLAQFPTPAVITHGSRAIASNIPGMAPSDIDAALRGCAAGAECSLHLNGANWLSVPMQSGLAGDGFELRSLVNADAAIAPVQATLHHLFLVVGLGSLLVTLLCSLVSSRSIVRPIAAMVTHLHDTANTGTLPEFERDLSSIREIQELVQNYNRAAVSVRVAQETLQAAYVEFVGSLASALDARDPYTAGHSRRVSDYSRVTALAMRLSSEEVERVRVGALLHDIGKIGVADAVLQKSGRLTDEEFAEVKKHPVVGKHILQGVRGLAPYLAAVELHHENWDGSGYPAGQTGEQTPVDARIIHVADAYDAMTSDRSYRRGLAHERAVEVLREYSGIQFDPNIVDLFARLPRHLLRPRRESTPQENPERLPEWEIAW